jgi:hypothetical protein
MTLEATGGLAIGRTSTGGNATDKVLAVEGTGSAQIALFYNNTNGAYLYSNSSNTVLSSVQNLPLVFNTNNAERARITSGGDLLVGTTTAGGAGATIYSGGFAKFIGDGQATANTVQNAFTNSNSNNSDLIEFNCGQFQKTCIYVRNSGAGAGNTVSHIVFQYGGTPTTAGSITSVGTTVTYGSASDIRLKNDLGVCTTSRIADVVIHDFEWKSTGVKAKGAFAQELQEIAPEAVVAGTDEVNSQGELKMPWQIDYSKLVPDLIVELQFLRKRVADLESALEAK